MMPDERSSLNQVGFFSDTGELGGSHPQFNEVCTALYERELIVLAHSNITNLSLLKRRMGGLPYHVKSVARYMVNHANMPNPSPLKADTHNGSWFAKQASKCPGLQHNDQNERDKCQQWYSKHAEYGLVVPVLITNIEGMHIELDSIDMTSQNKTELHLNKSGWFLNTGSAILKASSASSDIRQTSANSDHFTSKEVKHATMHTQVLLKPTKAIMASACCGHMWNYKSKRSPRALSMREMRLSTKINWRNFSLLPQHTKE